MRHRVRLVSTLVGLLALAWALGAQGAGAAAPSLTLSVNLSGTLEVVLGNGTRIRASSTPAAIPPGPYLVIVNSDVPDGQDVFHVFHLSGAGVNVSSDLLPCENPRELYTVTLRPGTTYTYEDSRHPELARVVLATSGDGSSADTSGSGSGPTGATYAGSVSNSSLLGSRARALAFRGTLAGTVGTGGKLTLRRKGKAVSTLKAGRYRIAVVDRTAKGGFTLTAPGRRPIAVTGAAFVGKHAVTITLRPGRWTAGGRHFTVVA